MPRIPVNEGPARPVVLAADTSTRVASAALVEGGVLTAEWLSTSPTSASRTLAAEIDGLLARRGIAAKDLDLLVTSLGPGSFTGVRVAMSVMKGLAFALSKPLIGVRSLEALARPLLGRDAAALVALDARRAEVYAALYAPDGRLLAGPAARDPAAFAAAAAAAWDGPVRCAGEGVLAYADRFREALGDRMILAAPHEHVIRAGVMATIALENPVPASLPDLEPAYLRRSEAEVKAGW